jgi:DNA-binding protein
MKETIDKHILAYDKSTYSLKLIRVSSNSFYVDLMQTIHDLEEVNCIKINPTALPDIIEILQGYKQILDESPINHPKYINEAVQQIIQNRYLKGVSIEDIALQTGKTEELIETTLRSRDIEIVSNKLPAEYFVSKAKKKRRSKRKR